MNKLYISCIICLYVLLNSCKRNEMVYDIVIDSQDLITLQKNETLQQTIKSGNGNYTVSISDERIAEATISENKLMITAKDYGETRLTIVDQKGKTLTLTLNVMIANNEDLQPSFAFGADSIALDRPNDWGLTFSDQFVAITNIDKKSQYQLTWNGGLSPGKKSNAVLKVVKYGQLAEITLLSDITIVNGGSDYCLIRFNKDNRYGELLFEK